MKSRKPRRAAFGCSSISTWSGKSVQGYLSGNISDGKIEWAPVAPVVDRQARRVAGTALTLVLALIGVMVAAALTGCSAPRATADAGRSLVQSAADLERDLGVLERATVAAKDVTPEKLEAARRQTRAHVAAIGTLGAQLVRLGETGKP